MNIYKQAENNVLLRRQKANIYAEKAYTAAMEIPEVCNAENAYCALLPKVSRCEALNIEDKELKNEFFKASKDREEAFKKYGINQNDFLPKYNCSFCNDTGYKDGNVCSCLKIELNSIITKEYGMKNFSSFSDNCNMKNPAIKKQLSSFYGNMEKYCEGFPDTKYTTLIFSGMPGTGKTYLASCMADRLIKKGRTVIFVSAFMLNEIFKAYHLDFKGSGGELLQNLYDCDFLIIDDLGTENTFKNITNEYLLSLVSERMHNGKHLLITTNFGDEKLYERYDGRLTSRLLDKRKTYVFNFTGDDLRQIV